jgi:hypothetical protein
MSDPRSAREGSSGHSPRLARSGRDPRVRTNAAAAVGDQHLDRGSLESASGKTRFSAWDAVAPLPDNASLAQVVGRLNLMLARGKGQ